MIVELREEQRGAAIGEVGALPSLDAGALGPWQLPEGVAGSVAVQNGRGEAISPGQLVGGLRRRVTSPGSGSPPWS